MFLDTPLSIIMCATGSATQMTSLYPSSTLLNRRFLSKTIFSVLTVFVGFVVVVYTTSCYPEYLPANLTGIYLGNENLSENTFFMLSYVCFIYNNIILIVFAIVVNKGIPFRKQWYKNLVFLEFVIIYLAIMFYFMFVDLTNYTYINWLRNYLYNVINYPIRNALTSILISLIFGFILKIGYSFISYKYRNVDL